MTMADDMWALIPAVYRARDADAGNVLRALIEVFGEQADVIHADIAQLYDNWFIETCDDWVVPYIGDLTGALPLTPSGEPPRAEEKARLAQVAPLRLMAANAIRFRRRKGCFSIIEQLARDATRWPAQAVEFGALLTLTQDVRTPSSRGFTAALRDPQPLARLGTADDPIARQADMREAGAARSPGRYGLDNVGVYVFTAQTVTVGKADAFCIDEEGSACFTFDPLGQDMQLYHPAQASAGGAGLPGPITRDQLGSWEPTSEWPYGWKINPALYGEEGCTKIWIQDRKGGEFVLLDGAAIIPMDLTSSRERPPTGFVAVDPERGRIAFPQRAAPRRVRVAYVFATPAAIGGGGYPRPRSVDETCAKIYPVTALEEEGHNSLRSAVEQWAIDGKPSAVIEFRDSLTYDEDRLAIDFSGAECSLLIRAAVGVRPVIRFSNYEAGAADAWRLQGDAEINCSTLALEGLVIAGRGIAAHDFGGALTIRHCSLIPGWLPCGGKGRRQHPDAPSLSFENCFGSIAVELCILGPVFVQADQHIEDPLRVSLKDTILDAGEGADAFLSSSATPFVTLLAQRCTVFGAVPVHVVSLVENSILTGPLTVARRSSGCVRFCALPPHSRTPRRVSCVPGSKHDPALRPVFVSQTYGAGGYAALAPTCPIEITRGADDRSEMGVYHNVFWPQRDANLRAALAEYLPAGTHVGISYVS